MKHLLIITSLLLSGTMIAQTKVIKHTAVKSNNYGITYSLPKTALVVRAEVTKVTCEAGPYYKFAEKYLGVKDAVTKSKVYYELGKVTLTNKGIPDPDQTYMVEFKAGTVAPYVYLTEEGLLCTINTEYTPDTNDSSTRQEAEAAQQTFNPAVLPEELLLAGNTTREAEIAARQIYRIRESRMNILTGEADNLPPDGEAMRLVMKQLDIQEKALTTLFTGSIIKETSYQDFQIIPYDNIDRDVIFRFSNLLGILDPDDLGGVPVYMNLKATERASTTPEGKEAEKKQKALKGVVYNIPGKANVEIAMHKNILFKGEVQVVQFGTREGLAPVMFEDKKAPVKVYFYPETGALKQVIQ